MRVLIVSQYFWPEYFRVNDLAIELVKKNIEVDVLTGQPNYPGGKIFEEFLLNKEKFNKFENINIFRVPIVPRKNGSKFQLFINYISFLFSGIFYGSYLLKKKKYDHIITFATSPILVGLVSIFLCKIKKAKHLIWVLDLWPDVLDDLKIIKKNTLLYKFFIHIVNYIYDKSDVILCQSLAFKKEIGSLKKSYLNKINFFPSWPEDTNIINNSSNLIPEIKYDNNFINILFAGNIGEAQNFDLVIKVIKSLAEHKVRFYVLGEGRDFKRLEEARFNGNINNLFLLGLKKFDEIQYYLCNADYLLITLQYKKTFNSTIPGKFQTYIKYKKKILGFVGGETNKIINKYMIGKAFNYVDDQSFVNDVKNYLINEKKDIKILSYDILLKIYSKKRLVRKIVNILNFLSYKNIEKVQLLPLGPKNINFKHNFIVSGLNLAFLGYYSAKKLSIHRSMLLWPDGFFKKKFFPKNINKIPGRVFLKQLIIDTNVIKRIIIIGNLDYRGVKYINDKFKLKLVHIHLPIGNLNDFKKYIPIFKEHDICLITLPTPKQENLACFIADNQKFYKLLCIGGAINMSSGTEKPLPEKFSNIFFAETLWRLQFDTKRRFLRLIETFFWYVQGELSGKFKKIKFFYIE